MLWLLYMGGVQVGGKRMSDYMLVHLNVVRPLGAFTASHPNAVYFFSQLPAVFAKAKADDGLLWHNHGARTPQGGFADMNGILALQTERTKDNFDILTMAGWKDAAALHRFAYRDPLHRDGMKTLRDWVDRSDGATMVMWWERRGTRVTLETGWQKLLHLRAQGPTPDAFCMQTRFDMPV
ncbi:DUF3291 domain-containing protein [uncultured Tateyamaria sp.]|uniref:DUF3291 domain-containing protein n=1 Tax=Tateyamaria sp. 1078 TaxID=3417464 RepID=UPI002605E439|nr:DUF3291 domain-containing protein [uncultured Tateyamaria sp.]